jgi:hypothetical protein
VSSFFTPCNYFKMGLDSKNSYEEEVFKSQERRGPSRHLRTCALSERSYQKIKDDREAQLRKVQFCERFGTAVYDGN